MIQTKVSEISVETSIKGELHQVWRCFTTAEHIINWHFASDDWHVPYAKTTFEEGGEFCIRMKPKSESQGFDFKGTYTSISNLNKIHFTLEDGRKVVVNFSYEDGLTHIHQSFEMENEMTAEDQQAGWQAILSNFKTYAESLLCSNCL